MKKLILFLTIVLFSLTGSAQFVGFIASTSNQGVFPPVSQKWSIAGGIARGHEKDMNESNLQDIYMRYDGRKYWIIGATGDSVKEYDTAVPFLIEGSTLNFTFSVAGQENIPTGIEFSNDGTIMLITGLQQDAILRYDLSTAWSVATATYTSSSGSLGAGGLFNLALNNDGTQVQVCYQDFNQRVYTFSTPYDPTTISSLVDSENTGSAKFSNFGFNEDGTQAWGADENSGIVYTWDLGTTYDWINTRTNEVTQQSVYYTNLRAGEFTPGRYNSFILGGAGTNVEAKQHWMIDDMAFDVELANNADFDATGSWTIGAGWTIAGNGTAVQNGGTGNQILKSASGVDLTDGQAYVVRLNILSQVGTGTNPTTLTNLLEDQNLIASDWYFFTENINTGVSQILQTYGRGGEDMTVDYFGVRKYDVSDVETIQNGTFDVDDQWTELSNWQISGGVAECLISSSGQLRQNNGYKAGTYRVELDIVSRSSGSIGVRINDSTYAGNWTTTGSKTVDIVVPDGSGFFDINAASGFVGSIDNVSVKKID